MARPVPTRSTLRASAQGGRRLKALPPLLLGFALEDGVDPGSPATLLHRCVRVGPVVNPALDAVLTDAGAERKDERSYAVALGGKGGVGPDGVERILQALPAAALLTEEDAAKLEGGSRRRPGAAKRVRDLLESHPSTQAAVARVGFDPSERQSKERSRGTAIAVRITGRSMRLTFVTAGFAPEGGAYERYRLGSVKPTLLLTPSEAFERLDAALSAGTGVVDTSRTPSIVRLGELVDSSLVADRVPGAPGLALMQVGTGTGLEVRSGEVGAVEALAAAGTHHLDTPVAVHPDVVEAADLDLAGPVGRPGLREYQDHYCSLYALTTRGIVNALEPGMGKTVCTAAAFQERSRGGRWRGLVAVPVGLRDQWALELAKFFPEARNVLVASEADAEELGEELAGTDGPVTVIVSHDGAGRYLEHLLKEEWDDMAVDEATILRSTTTKRAQALWQLRGRAKRATALTGTPVEKSLGDLVHLAAWALGDQELLSHEEGDEEDVLRRLGAYVFRRTTREISAELPEVEVVVHHLTPTRDEQQLLNLAIEHVEELLEEAERLRRAGKAKEASKQRPLLLAALNVARMAATDPSAVASSGAGAADRLRTDALVRGVAVGGAKRKWLSDLTRDVSEAGGRVLACTDYPAAATSLAAAAEAAGIRCGALTGSQPPVVRTGLAAAFTQGELELLTLSGAGRQGLNLQAATDIVHLDIPGSRTQLQQRTARAVRLGGKNQHLRVHVPVLAGSLDAAYLSLVQDVLDRVEGGGGESALTDAVVDTTTEEGIRALVRQLREPST